jgi:hypothetical protein
MEEINKLLIELKAIIKDYDMYHISDSDPYSDYLKKKIKEIERVLDGKE